MRKVRADVLAGLRIFRMLQEKKQLEQKQIAEFAMVPVREAREVLYKMLKGGFLALQVCCARQTGQSCLHCGVQTRWQSAASFGLALLIGALSISFEQLQCTAGAWDLSVPPNTKRCAKPQAIQRGSQNFVRSSHVGPFALLAGSFNFRTCGSPWRGIIAHMTFPAARPCGMWLHLHVAVTYAQHSWREAMLHVWSLLESVHEVCLPARLERSSVRRSAACTGPAPQRGPCRESHHLHVAHRHGRCHAAHGHRARAERRQPALPHGGRAQAAGTGDTAS